jgi:uncharacterized protein YndB with AHSA1/START domain
MARKSEGRSQKANPRSSGRPSSFRLPPSAFRLTQRYNASASRVFDAWLDPAMASTWLFATATRPLAHVEIDARAGGRFRLREEAGDAGTEYRGRYLEIVPARRLVFTLTMKNSPAVVTRVIAEIVPLRAGCELRVTHENVPPDHASRIEGRWAGMLYGLGTQLRSKSVLCNS